MRYSRLLSGLVASVLAVGTAHADSRQQKAQQAASEAAEKLNPFPKPSLGNLTLATAAPYYAFGSVFCAAGGLIGSAIVKSAEKHGELTNEEAATVVASCFLPFIGAPIVKALYAAHPEWNALRGPVLDRDKVDLMKLGIGVR